MAEQAEERVMLTEPTEGEDAEEKEETLSQKLERLEEKPEVDTESVYKPPTEDPYTKAVKYMEMHNVMQIFQHLTSEIVYHRPIDPLVHMLEELQKMKDERDNGGDNS